MSARQSKRKTPVRKSRDLATAGARCGLCGATKKLTKTRCCGQWICDDEDKYVMFSYARNSCSRNHQRYTLCGFHAGEGHAGHWKDCQKCREEFEAEMYAYYGTNEYNFEVLENPPEFEPTKCSRCGAVIHLAEDGYSYSAAGYKCARCADVEFSEAHARKP